MALSREAHIEGTGEQIFIDYPEPLESARLFKAVSDTLYGKKPRRSRALSHRMHAPISGVEARGLLVPVLDAIDSRLASA